MKVDMNRRNDPLVTIITPCYNGEKFIHKFLDSVLGQSYQRLELIMVNDGSEDTTETIILSYKPLFEKKGMKFIYLYQENKGQAAAINHGLTQFSGDYLTWPDSDDVFHEDSIRDRVQFLEHSNYEIVVSDCAIIDENGNMLGTKKRRIGKDGIDYAFDDLIMERNTLFAGGAYMVSRSAFYKAHPSAQIFESRGGQNWQLLLPILYENRCGYLHKSLYFIVARSDSHSRNVTGAEKLLRRCNEHELILLQTMEGIQAMPDVEKKRYYSIIKKKYALKRFKICVFHEEPTLLKQYFQEVRKYQQNNFLHYSLSSSSSVRMLYRLSFKAMKSIRNFVRTKFLQNK